MVVGAEKQGSGVYSGKNDARVTPIGKILRATSIDELPQLINIFKGEMSFIGAGQHLPITRGHMRSIQRNRKKCFRLDQV